VKTINIVILLLLGATSAVAANLPVLDGFESYADGTTLNTLSSQGWGASSNTVVIRTVTNVADAVRGTNAVSIPGGLTASNVVTASALSNVWVDVYVQASMGMSPALVDSAGVDSNMTMQVFFDTSAHPVVWNPSSNAWLVCTQDYWRADMTTFNTSAWVRLTMCQNYSNKMSSLFMNEHLLFTGLRFIDTNRTSYGRFQMDGGTAVTSYFDQVSMDYTPPANWTADLDNDGMSDAQEIQLYGNMTTRHRPVITVTVPAYGTVTTNGFGAGVVTNGGSFDVKPGATNSFWLAASNGYYVADAKTNGASVGNFSGQFTSNALCGWTNIMPDGLSDATFELVVQPNPQVTVTTPSNGWVTPLVSQVYPFQPVAFTFGASNGYYVANVYTNGVNIGAFTGRYTDSGSYTWPSVATNGGPLVVEFFRNLQLTAAALASGGLSPTGGAVTLSASEVYPNGQVTCALTADVAYAAALVRTNGVLATTFGGQSRTASCTISNIWADMTVTGVFTYTATRYVPNDYSTLQSAVTAALTNDTIIVGANVYTNNVTLDKSLTLIATNVTLDGALTVAAGTTGTLAGCQGLVVTGGVTVASNGLLVVNGGSNNVGTLTVLSGGTVQVVNAAAFIVDGTTFTGTFTFAYGWDATLVSQLPPYADPFERYAIGAKMSRMGFFGWVATSDSVVVQTNQVQSGQAVMLPAQDVLSSTMTATGASNVWCEFYYQDTNRIPSAMVTAAAVDTNVAVQLFINTNGYVTVFNPTMGAGQWDVCSNDVLGGAVSNLANNAWVRLSINQNYTRGKAAVFLNGRLLRQELRFINTNLVNSGKFEVDAGYAGPTYFDTYSVRTSWVGIVSIDADDDGWADAKEIDDNGNLQKFPDVGSVFTIR